LEFQENKKLTDFSFAKNQEKSKNHEHAFFFFSVEQSNMAAFVAPSSVTMHPSLKLNGRSPMLSEAVPPNTLLARVPISETLSSQSLLTSVPAYATLLSFSGNTISDDDLLAIYIVRAMSGGSACDGGGSSDHQPTPPPLTDFINNFPETYDSPVFFDPESPESKLLRNTTVSHLATRLQHQISADHDRIRAVLDQFLAIHSELAGDVPTLEAFDFGSYVTALFSVYSRAADIELSLVAGSGGGELARKRLLIPVLDMFNHDPKSTVTHKFNAQTLSVDIVTNSETVPAGEVFLNYGALPNQRLLLFYGFSLANNPHDTADLFVPLSPEIPLYQRKLALLQRCFPKYVPNAALQIGCGGQIPDVLMALLRLMPIASEEEMGLIEGRVGGEGKIVPMLSQEIEMGALSALDGALTGMSQAIAVNLLDCAEELRGVEKSDVMEFARVYAASEWLILSEALGQVKAKMVEVGLGLERGGGGGGGGGGEGGCSCGGRAGSWY
jgi:hypothetical protein